MIARADSATASCSCRRDGGRNRKAVDHSRRTINGSPIFSNKSTKRCAPALHRTLHRMRSLEHIRQEPTSEHSRPWKPWPMPWDIGQSKRPVPKSFSNMATHEVPSPVAYALTTSLDLRRISTYPFNGNNSSLFGSVVSSSVNSKSAGEQDLLFRTCEYCLSSSASINLIASSRACRREWSFRFMPGGCPGADCRFAPGAF